MPDFYYGYLIPRSLFFKVGTEYYTPPYTEELYSVYTEAASQVDSASRAIVNHHLNRQAPICVTIISHSRLSQIAKPFRVMVNDDPDDDWWMIAVAHDLDERVANLKKYPDLPTDEELQRLKVLLDLPMDKKPERYEKRDS
ncbi:hypothetical protein BJ138DRAFT_1131285 [Hygrophoropsis aurantiaca]|uniref:Uncharacterized protein n=1 Tax=Hygrophoropsis aurantiaca TaxID=72124 RepID=A0ACB7ZS25_9AGAM|nr:hypothetical protein BJ138DRAFT_1131285 [Hygrophoropsis aurantiaca]